MADKKAVSPVIGVLLMVATTVVLAAALYVWISGMLPGGKVTPTITVSTVDSEVDSGAYGADKSISCKVDNFSRPDIKWNDLEYTVLVNESVPHNATVYYTSFEKCVSYVSAGDTITVKCNELADRTRVKLTMTYVPTKNTAGVWSVTCT